MTLAFVLKFIGWAFVIMPTVVFLSVSFQMIKGAGEDDAMVRALSLIGLTVFLMGAVVLALMYATNFLP